MTEIDPAAFQIYKQTALRRRRFIRDQVEARMERAWEVARSAADILREEFQVTKVVAFGSMTHDVLFHQHSDVDLAVWDLDDKMYFRAVGRLQSIDSMIDVDLIPYIDAKPALQDVIQREGVII